MFILVCYNTCIWVTGTSKHGFWCIPVDGIPKFDVCALELDGQLPASEVGPEIIERHTAYQLAFFVLLRKVCPRQACAFRSLGGRNSAPALCSGQFALGTLTSGQRRLDQGCIKAQDVQPREGEWELRRPAHRLENRLEEWHVTWSGFRWVPCSVVWVHPDSRSAATKVVPLEACQVFGNIPI